MSCFPKCMNIYLRWTYIKVNREKTKERSSVYTYDGRERQNIRGRAERKENVYWFSLQPAKRNITHAMHKREGQSWWGGNLNFCFVLHKHHEESRKHTNTANAKHTHQLNARCILHPFTDERRLTSSLFHTTNEQTRKPAYNTRTWTTPHTHAGISAHTFIQYHTHRQQWTILTTTYLLNTARAARDRVFSQPEKVRSIVLECVCVCDAVGLCYVCVYARTNRTNRTNAMKFIGTWIPLHMQYRENITRHQIIVILYTMGNSRWLCERVYQCDPSECDFDRFSRMIMQTFHIVVGS